MKKKLIMLMAALLGGISFAETDAIYCDVKYSTSQVIVPGEWNCNFSRARSFALEHNLPLLVYWSNYGCSYCRNMEREFGSPEFVDWQKNGLGRNIVMVFIVNGLGGALSAESNQAKSFVMTLRPEIGKKLSAYPFVGVSWGAERESFTCRMSAGGAIAKVESILRDFHPSFNREHPCDIDVEYGLCEKNHYFLQEGTNWFQIATGTDIKYAVRLIEDTEKYVGYRFSIVSDDSRAKSLPAELGDGFEFANDNDGLMVFGVEAVLPDKNDDAMGFVEFDLQYVAMEPDTATCFPDVSMQYSSSCGCEEPRECDYKGWNIIPDGALVTGSATVGKVMWADTERELVYPSDVLKNTLEVNSQKTIWMQAIASGYIRSTKVSASFALGKCEAPTCSHEPISGDYGPQRVTLSTATSDAQIRYTVDGSDVNDESPIYGGSFVVSESTTVKAKAFKNDWVESDAANLWVDDGRLEIGEQEGCFGNFYEFYVEDGQLKIRFSVKSDTYGTLATDDYSATFEIIDEQSIEPSLIIRIVGNNRYKGEYEEYIGLQSGLFEELNGGVWFYRRRGGTAEIVSGPCAAEDLRIPAEIGGLPVGAIGPYAFAEARVKKLTLPSTLKRIEEGAFSCCTGLEDVEGAAELEFVGDEAFGDTPFYAAIYEATPSDSIVMIGGCAYVVKGQLSGVVALSSGTRGISSFALSGQNALTQVVLPEGLRSIGSYAFADCESLASVDLPDSLVNFGEGVFDNTMYLSNLYDGARQNSMVVVGDVLLGVKGQMPSRTVVPENVKVIAGRAFASCEDQEELTEIVLPAGLRSVGPYAFAGCNAVTSIAFPSSVASVSPEAFWETCVEAVITESEESAARIREQLSGWGEQPWFIGTLGSLYVRLDGGEFGWTKDGEVYRTSEFDVNDSRWNNALEFSSYGRGTLRFKWAVREADYVGYSTEECDKILSIGDALSENYRSVSMCGVVSGFGSDVWNSGSTEVEFYENGIHAIVLEFHDEEEVLFGTAQIEIKDLEWIPATDGLGIVVKLDPRGGTLTSADTLEPGIVYGPLPEPVRVGCEFLGWTDQDITEIDDPWSAHFVQEGDSTPLVSEVTLHALWERYDPNSYEGEWYLMDNGFFAVVDPSERIYDEWGNYYLEGGRAACSYETPGRGWVSFKWRVVSAEDTTKELYAESTTGWSAYSEGQRLILRTDSYMDSDAEMYELLGIEDALLYYTKGWKTERVAVASGDPMEYIWEFQNNRNESVVVQIADVIWEWAPADTQIIVTLDPCGGTLADGNQIVCGSIYEGLPTPEREGAEFIGWTAEDYYDPYSCTIVGDGDWTPLADSVTLRAVWDVPVEIALDPYYTIQDDERGNRLEIGDMDYYYVSTQWDIAYDFDGDGEPIWETMRQVWAGERVNWQGQLTMGEERDIVRAYVHGCGIYHFSRLSCWNDGVVCRVYVDGVLQDLDSEFEFNEYFSNGPGIDVEIREKPGYFARCDGLTPEDEDYDLHEIRVAVLFKGSKSVCGYEEERWVNGEIGPMRWTASPASLEVTFDGCGGIVSGESVRTFEVGSMYGVLPDVERKDFEFLGWFTKPDGGEQVLPFELVRLSATKLYARWKTDLITALSDGKLRYATKHEDWVGTADLSHGSNGVCATTGELMWGETKVMTTVVQGRGLLSFWWMQGEDLSILSDDKASLTLWLDDKLIAECRGTSAWKHMTLPVLGKGNHKVEWKYTPGTGYIAIDDGWDYYGYLTPMLAWEEQSRLMRLFNDGPVHAPGAWVDEVGWTPGSEVKSIIPWARGIVEGRGWLTEQLPLIEAEYTAKIAQEPLNYEWRILRAITKLFGLGENENLKAVLAQFGLTPDYQVLGNFFGELDYFDAPLSNEIVDALAAEAVPVFESALADLDAIPSDWTGSIPLDPAFYPVDVVTYVDLADVTLYKAALKGALSALAIAEGYDLSVDYMNGEMEEILAEAGLPVTFEYLVEDHPELAKRVRDAERLGEGKEILRDALETLQVFDELMLGRTTSEMHFFEYDEKDADKQQYAREEVAKMLVALDGETVISNDDFRYARNFAVSEMNQPATLAPFFSGNVTRRYLPTEIHDNHPVFDSFPTMSFGGTFPGLTKDTVAGWLAENGREVEYTPNSDYEPEVLFRTFNAAIPNLGASATEEEIEDALAGTADAKVKANITDAKSYAAYETWATKVQSAGVPLKAVKASPCSWQSFALAAPELMQGEITDDDLMVEEFKPSSESGKFDFTVSVKDVTVGSEAVEENLKQVIGLEGAESLGEVFKSENVAIKFGQPEDGKLKFTAEPKNAEAKSFFMKMKVK